MTETQTKLALTAGFALALGGLIAYQISRNPSFAPNIRDAGASFLGDSSGAVTSHIETAERPTDAGSTRADIPDALEPLLAATATAEAQPGSATVPTPTSMLDAATDDSGSQIADRFPVATAATSAATSVPLLALGKAISTASTSEIAKVESLGDWNASDATEAVRAAILKVIAVSTTGEPSDSKASLIHAKRIRIGQLLLPTGRLGVYDCLSHGYLDKEEVIVPAGSYPVDVVVSKEQQAAEADVYAAMITIGPGKPTTLKQAYTSSASSMMLCMASPEAIRVFEALEQDSGAELLLGIAHPDGGAKNWSFGSPPKSKLSIGLIHAPTGPIPVYQAYDERGHLVGIVTPLKAPL